MSVCAQNLDRYALRNTGGPTLKKIEPASNPATTGAAQNSAKTKSAPNELKIAPDAKLCLNECARALQRLARILGRARAGPPWGQVAPNLKNFCKHLNAKNFVPRDATYEIVLRAQIAQKCVSVRQIWTGMR